jgi:hypothetical protein
MTKLLSSAFSFLLATMLTVPAAWAAIVTTTNPAGAPTGTHLQTGTISCTVNPTTQLVSCTSFELAGVGNANATGTLTASYSATVLCRNHGDQIVEVKTTVQSAPTSTGNLAPENGRLLVTALSSGPVPTAAQFFALATCPNKNWTKELSGSIELTVFTYTLQFADFPAVYLTIEGP